MSTIDMKDEISYVEDRTAQPLADEEVQSMSKSKKLFTATALDQAVNVKSASGAEADRPIDADEERRLMRKLDRRILPLMCLTQALQYADKAAISSAAIVGLITDLGLYTVVSTNPVKTDTTRYSTAVAMFWVGFLLGNLPLGWLTQRVHKRLACGALIVAWGLTALLTAVCTDYQGLYAQRFFLGFLESGVNPAFFNIISAWYSKSEQAFRAPVVNSAQAFAIIPFTMIFFGCTYIDPDHGWKYIYYIIGAITMVWGVVIYFLLPDSPATSRWLNARERYVAVERLRDTQAAITTHLMTAKGVLATFTDIKVYVLLLMGFCMGAPSALLGAFSGLVVKGIFTGDTRHALLFNMPIGLFGGLLNLLGGFISMRFRNARVAMYIFFGIICTTGLALDWALPTSSPAGLLVGLLLIASYSAGFGQVIGLATSNAAGASKKTTLLALTFMMTGLQGIICPYYYFGSEAPRYPSGFLATLVHLIVGLVAAVVYGALCYFENKKRDRLPQGDDDHAFEGLSDKVNMSFRYSW